MIKERIFKGLRIFSIDSNGDNYMSFKLSCEYFQNKDILNPNYQGGFDTERFKFTYLKISCELVYSGFFGTELRVNKDLSMSDLSKVRQWAEDIFNFIHNN